MAVFSLAGLPRHLLQKIITKFEEKSYFRLQQTCHSMEEFVKKSRNISVHVSGHFKVKYNTDDSSWRMLKVEDEVIEVQEICGARIVSFFTPDGNIGVDDLCDSLKKHRITCARLLITRSANPDSCVVLSDVLKPKSIHLENDVPGFQAVHRLKTVEGVIVTSLFSDVIHVAKELFPKFPLVTIATQLPNSDATEPLDLVHTLVKLLLPKSAIPSLHKFSLLLFGGGLPTGDDVTTKFRGFDLTINRDNGDEVTATMQMPDHFPPGACCFFSFKHCASGIPLAFVSYDRAKYL